MTRGDEEPTRRLPEDSGGNPTEALPGEAAGQPTAKLDETRSGRRLGYVVLFGSILASILLCGAYIGFGGLDYRPSGGTYPCAPRPWGSPRGLEETAERFSLAAIDGASCELGVNREQLIRALAGDRSRERFAADHGLTEAEIEDALRAGLLRATDDAERGGALSGLAATGARLAIKVMPMSVMVALIDNASSLFGRGYLDSFDGVLGGALDLLDGPEGSPGTRGEGGSDTGPLDPKEIPGRVGGALTDQLKRQLPPEVQQVLPEDLGSQVEKGLDNLIRP